MCPFSQDSGEKLGIYAFCSIACLLMALSCSLIIPLPGQGKVPAGPTAPICWALQLSDVAWRLLQQGPAMLLTSSTVFLAKRWSSGKKAVRASCPGRYKPWPQTFLFLWRQYDSCLHHAYREHHKWAQSRLEIGDSLLKGVRGCAGPALLQDVLLKPGSVVGKERGPTLLAYIQQLRKWLLSAAQWWQCLETATQVTHWIKWEKPAYNNTNKWQEKPSFLYSPLKKHRRVLKTPNVCPQSQINIKSVPSRCLPNSLQEVLRTEVFYPAWWGYAGKLRF